MPVSIDLNSDLGESLGRWSLGDDAAMFAVVTSANIACGFHAGDPVTMRDSARLAVRNNVAIGAHPGYPDLAGFGRRPMGLTADEVYAAVLYQVSALRGIAESVGGQVGYIKPHGALYNRAMTHDAEATAIAHAARDCDLAVVGLPGSALFHACMRAGVRYHREGFADRGYLQDGSLAPRGDPAAVITDPATVAERAVRITTRKEVETVTGDILQLDVDSLCVHGDTPGAVTLARAVRQGLETAGAQIRALSQREP